MNKKILAAVGLGSTAAIAVFAGAKLISPQVATKEVDQAIAALSPVVDVEYQKVSAPLFGGVFGGNTTVKNVTLTPVGTTEPIKANELVVHRYEKNTNNMPTDISLEMKGIQVAGADLAGEGTLTNLGYDEDLSLDMTGDYRYDEAAKAIRLDKLKMGADDMGDLEVSLHVENVALDEEAIASFPFSFFGMEFHAAEISYKDDSFVKRMFDTAAAAEGVSVEEYKETLISEFETEMASTGEELPPELVKAFKDFINNPKSFSITASPDSPISLTEIMLAGENADIVELLNLRFKS